MFGSELGFLISSDSTFLPQKPQTNLTDVILLIALEQTGPLHLYHKNVSVKSSSKACDKGLKAVRKTMYTYNCHNFFRENVWKLFPAPSEDFHHFFLNWQEVFWSNMDEKVQSWFGIASKKTMLYCSCQYQYMYIQDLRSVYVTITRVLTN